MQARLEKPIKDIFESFEDSDAEDIDERGEEEILSYFASESIRA